MRYTEGIHSFPRPHSGSDTLQNRSTSEILKSNIPRFYSLLTLIFPFFPLLLLNCNKPSKPLTTVHIMYDKIQDLKENNEMGQNSPQMRECKGGIKRVLKNATTSPNLEKGNYSRRRGPEAAGSTQNWSHFHSEW